MMARTPDLDPGDGVEFTESVNIRPNKGTDVWIKMGVSSTVRDNETGGKAMDRIKKFVAKKIGAEVDEWYDDE